MLARLSHSYGFLSSGRAPLQYLAASFVNHLVDLFREMYTLVLINIQI